MPEEVIWPVKCGQWVRRTDGRTDKMEPRWLSRFYSLHNEEGLSEWTIPMTCSRPIAIRRASALGSSTSFLCNEMTQEELDLSALLWLALRSFLPSFQAANSTLQKELALGKI